MGRIKHEHSEKNLAGRAVSIVHVAGVRCGRVGGMRGGIMEDAAAEGEKIITLTSSKFGIGLYKKFSFQHLYDYWIYKEDQG